VTTDLPSVEVYRFFAPPALEAELSTRLPQDRKNGARLASKPLPRAWRKTGGPLTQAYRGFLQARHT
jgi:hypothetical protein